jgi:hypothetical protein
MLRHGASLQHGTAKSSRSGPFADDSTLAVITAEFVETDYRQDMIPHDGRAGVGGLGANVQRD